MLIYNADDYGMSRECSLGIAAAHRQGVVNSTSVAVLGPVWEGPLLKELPDLALGLHVILTEPPFAPAIEQLSCEEDLSETDLYAEIGRQLRVYEEILGQPPAHIDCHQHFAYLSPTALAAFLRLACQAQLPIRCPRPFLDPERLAAFARRVESRFGLTLPFCPETRAAQLRAVEARFQPRWRTHEVLVDVDFRLADLDDLKARLAGESLEVVCHPRLGTEELDVLCRLRGLA